jgi:hypothetical protein
MRKMTALIIVLLIVAFTIGCAAHIHTVGKGPQLNEKREVRQYYFLWGLIPLNVVDTKAMAGDASDYEIRTETSFVDVLIGIPAGLITIQTRTVMVIK